MLMNEGLSERMYEPWAEMFVIPGFSPTIEQKGEMVGILRLADKFDEAIEMGNECLREMPSSCPFRWKMRFEVAACLTEVSRLAEALKMTLAVDDEGGHIEATKWLRTDALWKIQCMCDDFQQWMPVKERARRVYLDLRPYHASTKHNLGFVLCKQKKAKEGDQTEDMPIDMKKAFGEGFFIEKSGLIPRKKLKSWEFVPSTLIQVNRLTTPEGRGMNGKYGVVRSGPAAEGRLAVEIFAVDKGEEVCPVEYKPPVSLTAYNLDGIDLEYGDCSEVRRQDAPP